VTLKQQLEALWNRAGPTVWEKEYFAKMLALEAAGLLRRYQENDIKRFYKKYFPPAVG
jgi:hypothetical protein